MTTLTKKQEVSQHVLTSVLNQRQRVKEVEKALATEKAKLSAAEDQVIAALDEGRVVAHGQRAASIKVTYRRFVAWKQEFIVRLGNVLAEKVQAEAEPKTYKTLEIS